MDEEPKKEIIKKKRIRKKKVIPVELDVDMDPRRALFSDAYLNPMSNTFANAYQSAIKAGFSQEYAKNILTGKPKWLSEIIGRMGITDKVKANIKKHLELNTVAPVMTPFGPYRDKKTKKMMYLEDAKLLKIQSDMTMFVAEKIVDEFKKKDKQEPLSTGLEIKQIIILQPNGEKKIYNEENQQKIFTVNIKNPS